MSESVSTPRVSAQNLGSYIGRNVMLVGEVTQLRGDVVTINADGAVNVNLNREGHLTTGNGAQVIGKVNQDYTIKVLTSRDLGPDVDYGLVKAVVDATQYNKSLFVFEE